MTTSVSDILSVSFLQKEAKINNKLRVVPLFETLDDLINAKPIMESLFSKKWYRKLINNKQEVMIGYSDSSKDAGKICASWHQYKAQEAIVKLGKKFDVNVTFFHGRGGSPGRGGGPIQATLRSQPPGSVNGKIRITDQGEVIQQKYGYEPIAEYNLCSYIGAVTEATLNPPPTPKQNWRSLIEKMSEISKSSYRKNINQSSEFIKYFKTVTPSAALGKLSIGSRPSKRKNVDNIKSLRAIPWVFAWTQIRLMLPAWLGSAEALRYAYIKKFRRTLIDMEKNWPFFNSMLDILDMVITKADPEISKIYEKYLADKLETFKAELPPGYIFEVGGEAEARGQSQSNIFSSAILFFILIIITLVAALNSFRQAGLILSVAFWCTGLAFIGLTIGQANFGFIGLVGAIGLAGLSINDSIVVLSHIKEANANSPVTKEDLVEVIIRSTRHVITTSATTIGGFLPLLITSIFFKPLAWAMAGGVIGSAVIALFYIPACYAISKKL